MEFQFFNLVLLVNLVRVLASDVQWDPMISENQVFEKCEKTDLTCKGLNVVNKIVNNAIKSDAIVLSENVKLVKIPVASDITDGSRGFDDTVLDRVRRFLATHELQVKLSNVLPKREDIEDGLQAGINYLSVMDQNEKRGSGAIKSKLKAGNMLMMLMMIGGMASAMGAGGIGIMAMKAIKISGIALVLSLAGLLKKLVGGKGGGGGGGGSGGGGDVRVEYIPVPTGGGGGHGHGGYGGGHGGFGGGHSGHGGHGGWRKKRDSIDESYSSYYPSTMVY